MTSLFSSFDLKTFLFSIFFMTFLIYIGIFSPFSKMSFNSRSYYMIFSFISSFFSSLSSYNHSKTYCQLSLFFLFYIFVMNFSSLYPYNFAFSSQMSSILAFSLTCWGSIFIFSSFKNFKSQLSHFVPEGAPLGLSFFLFLIEVVSSLIRPITLAVRLVANILAGHLLVILLSMLVLNSPFTFPGLSFLNMVEVFVSFIQSYIFVTLLTLYFSEV